MLAVQADNNRRCEAVEALAVEFGLRAQEARSDMSWRTAARELRAALASPAEPGASQKGEGSSASTSQTRALVHAANVMAKLEHYGAAIWPHLSDTDDNEGEYLRQALRDLGIEADWIAPAEPRSDQRHNGGVRWQRWRPSHISSATSAVTNAATGQANCICTQ